MIVEWHVFLVHNQPTNSLLSVPAGELISQLGSPRLPYEHLYQRLVVICIRNHDFVDIPRDWRLVRHCRVFVRYRRGLSCKGVIVGVRRGLFIDVHIARIDSLPNACEAVRLDDIVLFVNLSVFYGGIRKPIKPVHMERDVSIGKNSRTCEDNNRERKRE